MNATKTQPRTTRFARGLTPTESQRAEPQSWPADSETLANCDALVREFLKGLENEDALQNRQAGYKSESQGQ